MTSIIFSGLSSSSSGYQDVTRPSGISGIFGDLAKSWNVSIPALIVVGVLFLIGIIIIVIITRYILKRKNESLNKTWVYRKEPKIMLLDDDFDKCEFPYGAIDMTIMYDNECRNLKIQRLYVHDISNIDEDIPDCYIKVFMKNKDGKKLNLKQTRTIDDNLNPTFPEVFNFNIEKIEEAVIYFQLFDKNTNGNDIPMGDGQLNLGKIDPYHFVGFFYPTHVILDEPSEVVGCGDVCIILNYNFPKLHITVLEAKNVIYKYKTKINKNSDRYPFVFAVVKVYVQGHKKKTFKTKFVENTRDPYFYETFIMTINVSDLQESVIKVELREIVPGRLSKRIGTVHIGNKFYSHPVNNLGTKHMELVIKNNKCPQAMWHPLLKKLNLSQ